jgi:hypothetical protein
MGVLDVAGAGLGFPRGLIEAIADRRFAAVVMDYKVQWPEWPGIELHYGLDDYILESDGAPMWSGADTAPTLLLTPLEHPPRPPSARVIGDFERGTWDDWTATGGFGPAPEVARLEAVRARGFGGRHWADSRAGGGEAALGRLASPPFRLGKRLSLRLGGDRDGKLRVELTVGDRLARVASPSGGERLQSVDWFTHELAGQYARLLVIDDSPAGFVLFDEAWVDP